MTSSDNDEDFKSAVAMSLQRSSPATPTATTSTNTVDLISDAEDADGDVRQAIALSLKHEDMSYPSDMAEPNRSQASPVSLKSTAENKHWVQSQASSAPLTSSEKPSVLTGLDRKAMEQERLARLGKRKRDTSPDRPSKQVATRNTTQMPNHDAPNKPSGPVLQYPLGVIKRTSATKYPRTNDISIDEVLSAPKVHTAVISSFMWDQEWLERKLNPSNVKQIWIMNAKGRDIQHRWREEMEACGIPNMKLHFPPMDGSIVSMHSKFMLLFGKERLRFVVPTANMTPIDWGEVTNEWQPGVMENSVFLVDLPRRSDGRFGDKKDLTAFGKELIYFMEQQQVESRVIEGVLNFDFSKTERLGFVHSVAGTLKGKSGHPTGLSALSQTIHDLNLHDVAHIELDYAASSLGAINDGLLTQIYLAATGQAHTPSSNIPEIRKHIRIYFPTNEIVQNSTGGPDCGGIISLTKQHYNAATFPHECLRTYDSTRRGMLSHNKLLFARGHKKDGTPLAWVYVGSANISESAWGSQKVLKSGQMGTLITRNWECGVVMPVPDEKLEGLQLGEGEVPPMSVFEGTVEVPFQYPGERFGGKQPWFKPRELGG